MKRQAVFPRTEGFNDRRKVEYYVQNPIVVTTPWSAGINMAPIIDY